MGCNSPFFQAFAAAVLCSCQSQVGAQDPQKGALAVCAYTYGFVVECERNVLVHIEPSLGLSLQTKVQLPDLSKSPRGCPEHFSRKFILEDSPFSRDGPDAKPERKILQKPLF
jgi:hypothetical protein